MTGRQRHTHRRKPLRRGVITLELLLNLPVWLIALLAIILFGQLIANLQHVAFASRLGAEAASQLASVPVAGFPGEVKLSVEQHLQGVGINPSGMWLEHNVNGPYAMLSDESPGPAPLHPLPATGKYVRLTVYVPLDELTPNVLGTYGFDISGKFAQYSTTFHYEN